MSITKYGEWYE